MMSRMANAVALKRNMGAVGRSLVRSPLLLLYTRRLLQKVDKCKRTDGKLAYLSKKMLTSVQAPRFPPLHSEFPSPIIVQSIVIDPSDGLTLMSTASTCNVLPLKGTMSSSGIYWKSRECK